MIEHVIVAVVLLLSIVVELLGAGGLLLDRGVVGGRRGGEGAPGRGGGGGARGGGVGIVPVAGAARHVGLLVRAVAVGGGARVIVAGVLGIPGPLRRVIARVAVTVTRVVVWVCMMPGLHDGCHDVLRLQVSALYCRAPPGSPPFMVSAGPAWSARSLCPATGGLCRHTRVHEVACGVGLSNFTLL